MAANKWVGIATPSIITKQRFERTQKLLEMRSPKITPPRLVTNSVLLSGIAYCDNCGSRLMITTGKSGKYRYYSCAKKHLKGKASCNNPAAIPEKKLDDIVTLSILGRVLEKKRIRKLLQEVFNRAKVQNKGAKIELKILRKNLKAMDNKIAILFDALTDGLVKEGDSFKTHLQKLERERVDVSKNEIMVTDPKAALVLAIGSKKLVAGRVPRFARIN